MNATVIRAWLAEIDSDPPSPASKSVGLPPSPSPSHSPPSRASCQGRSQARQPQKTNNYCPTAAASADISSPLSSLFSHTLSQASFHTPSDPNTPESLPSTVTGSSGASEQNPLMKVLELNKLDIPVRWRETGITDLRRRLDNHGSAGLLTSITSARDIGFLPLELRQVLDAELVLGNKFDWEYAKTPSAPVSESQLRRAKFLAGTTSETRKAPSRRARGNADPDTSLSSFIHLQSLLSELEILRTIVATTKDYTLIHRSEASWNEAIHSRMLKLAVSRTPGVGVENITHANIANDFLPLTSARYMSVPSVSWPIDYAMVLKPSYPPGGAESHENSGDGSGSSKEPLNLDRINSFLRILDYPSFNQSSYPPLRTMPSGIFIQTKVNLKKSLEAQAELGVWLASWYGRVSEFPNVRDHDGGNDDDDGHVLPPPVLPILLVQDEHWKLYFAFNAGSHYGVCGGVKIGSTDTLDDAYRLLAVLRVLAKWMETDFRAWVEDCLSRAGV
ncbi:hypothetical protein F5Y14DRAFT_464692 [Nemania sp. NC0429]|nr:hypothetical protein F5Y14DRAFT_464692 [Nemania sp. NC0429]